MATVDVAESLDRVRQHDPEASRALVEQLYPLVMRIVQSHLPRRTPAEDLAQEVFLKLFSRLDQYEERSGIPFEHWVARVAVRTCRDALRAERRRPEVRWADLSEAEVAWLDYLISEEPSPPESSPAAAREVLERLLRQLSVDDRLVIHLLDLEQKSVREISAMTGWSPALVKVRAFRARRKLRRIAAVRQPEERYE